jgi:hypothetical protein
MCPDICVHKKCHELVIPVLWKIMSNKLCPIQQVFTSCVKSWLETLETSMLNVCRIPDSQWALLEKAMAEQDQIGWHLAMWGYLSQHWVLAIAANSRLKEDSNKGDIWARKTTLQLWEFSWEMWDHRNSILHDTQLESSPKICHAQINKEITKLYAGLDTYKIADHWYFDMPLALWLQKPLRSCRWWLNHADNG